MDDQTPVGSCSHRYHEDEGPITWSTFKFKACWNCRYFTRSENFPFLTTKEVAKKIDVCPATVRNKIHNDQLEAVKLKKRSVPSDGIGSSMTLGPPEKFFIYKESFERR